MKLTLGGIGLFGTNGALYPTLESNLRSLSPLTNLAGGGIHLIPNSQTNLKQKTHKLQLNSSARKNKPQVSFSIESIKLPEKTLDLKSESLLSSEITLQNNSIEKEKVTSSIKNVQTEISKENQLTDIHSQISSEFERLLSTHLESDTTKKAEHLKNLQKVQIKIQDWQDAKKNNQKESAKPVKALSQEQRISLQKIYEFYQGLIDKKNSLNSQLEKIKTSAEGGVENVERESQVSSNPIKGTLEEIGWSQKKIKVQGDSGSNYSEQTNNWNKWDQNPYKNFYEQENDYKSALNGGLGRSDGKENLAQPSQELSEDSQSQIEFQIATKLLSLISPPNIESYPKELLDSLRKEESPVTKVTTDQERDVTVKRESEQVEEIGKVGNCTIDSSMKNILQSQGQSEQNYYSVSCSNEETDSDYETTFGSRWGGAFPKTLFTLQDSTQLNKLDIKVKIDFEKETENSEYEFVIEFWGKQFNNTHDSKITGDFKYETELSDTNSTGAIVKLTNPNKKENIYLLTDLDG